MTVWLGAVSSKRGRAAAGCWERRRGKVEDNRERSRLQHRLHGPTWSHAVTSGRRQRPQRGRRGVAARVYSQFHTRV